MNPSPTPPTMSIKTVITVFWYISTGVSAIGTFILYILHQHKLITSFTFWAPILVLSLDAFVIVLGWAIICFPTLRKGYSIINKNAERIIASRPKAIFLVGLLLFLSQMATLAIMVGNAFFANLLDNPTPAPVVSHQKVSEPEITATNLALPSEADFHQSFPINDFCVELSTSSNTPVPNALVLLSPVSPEDRNSPCERAEVSDRMGCVSFPNVMSDEYCLRVIVESAYYVRVETKRVHPEISGAILRVNLDLMQRPVAVQYLDHFQPDKAALSSDQLSELGGFAAKIKRNETVLIIGFADSRGTLKGNEGLGKNRAVGVKTYFSTNGFSANSMECFSVGQRKPIVPNLTRGTPQNRRVMILLIEDDTAKPAFANY